MSCKTSDTQLLFCQFRFLATSSSFKITLCKYISFTFTAFLFLSLKQTSIERFHVTSRQPYWCSKTRKWRPCWCMKPTLWELNSFPMQTFPLVSINLHGYRPSERKRSILNWIRSGCVTPKLRKNKQTNKHTNKQ